MSSKPEYLVKDGIKYPADEANKEQEEYKQHITSFTYPNTDAILEWYQYPSDEETTKFLARLRSQLKKKKKEEDNPNDDDDKPE